MFRDIIGSLRNKNVSLDVDKILEDPVNNLHQYSDKLFIPKNGTRSVLILDNVHFISDPDQVNTIIQMSGLWTDLIFILSGDKIDNAFNTVFTGFPLGQWGRGA